MRQTSIGVPPPGEIKGFHDMELIAQRDEQVITAKFDRELLIHEGAIGDAFVPNTVCQSYLFRMAPLYSYVFAKEEGEPLLESAVRRPMLLGMTIAEEILRNPYLRPNIDQLKLHASESPQALHKFVKWSVDEYLFSDQRRTLATLLADYSKEFVEPGSVDHAHAVAIGSLTLLHLEAGRYANFSNNQARLLSSELQNFEGDLSELE